MPKLTAHPLRAGERGALMAALEFEARLHECRNLWLITNTAAEFYERLGYARCDRAVVPPAIAATGEFAELCPAGADVLMKKLM